MRENFHRCLAVVTLIARRENVGVGKKEEIKEITCCFSPGIKNQTCVVLKNINIVSNVTRKPAPEAGHKNCHFRIQFLNFSLGSKPWARKTEI
jgi:hypothetical protein